jgi:hypothetical protein
MSSLQGEVLVEVSALKELEKNRRYIQRRIMAIAMRIMRTWW